MEKQQLLEKYRFQDLEGEKACTYTARQAFEDLNNHGIKSRILHVPFEIEGEESVGHSYVVLDDQEPDDFPLNLPYIIGDEDEYHLSVEEVIARGVDMTEEFLSLPWSALS